MFNVCKLLCLLSKVNVCKLLSTQLCLSSVSLSKANVCRLLNIKGSSFGNTPALEALKNNTKVNVCKFRGLGS